MKLPNSEAMLILRIFLTTILIAPTLALAATPTADTPNCNSDLHEQDAFLSWTAAVDESILHHNIEKRGFVRVPLDWDNPPFSKPVNVFYRLIPSDNNDVNDKSKPIVVYLNGGPGYPSWRYHQLDFDYSNKDPEYIKKNSHFALLRKSFRILLVDQRGTDGLSCPLNTDCSDLDPEIVANFTGADPISMDYAAAIRKVVGPKEKFYIIAQSYGGYAGVYYMVNALERPNLVRTPTGIVFSSSAFPLPDDVDPLAQTRVRRQSQLALNKKLAKAYPDISNRIRKVRARVEAAQPGSLWVDSQFFMLGKGEHWEKAISDKFDQALASTDEQLQQMIEADPNEPPPLMNYILSPATHQNGLTDSNMARQLRAEMPFDEGMIDEMTIYATQDHVVIRRTDANPPLPRKVPSVPKIREALSKSNSLFTMAKNDPMVPRESSQIMISKIAPPGSQVVELDGGHSAIVFEDGYRLLKQNWAPKPNE